MDSNINNEKNGMQQDPMSWDNMQDGIFAKVLEEKPDYFKTPKRKRGGAWVFLAFALAIIGIAMGGMLFNRSGEQVSARTDSKDVIENEIERESQPLTEASSSLSVTSGTVDNTDQQAPSGVELPITPVAPQGSRGPDLKARTVESKEVNAAVGDRWDEVLTSTLAPIDVASTEIDSAESEVEQPNRQAVKIHMLDRTITPGITFEVESARVQVYTATGPNTKRRDTDDQCVWQLEGSAGAVFSGTRIAGSSPTVGLRNEHTTGMYGFSTGVGARYYVGRATSLYFGMSYEQAYQNIDIETERRIQVTESEVLIHVKHYVVGSRTVETYGDTTVNAIERNRLAYTNSFRWLNFNLGTSRSFSAARWQFTPSAGASYGRMWSEGYTVTEDGQIRKYDRSDPIFARHSIKIWGGMSVSRRITDRLSLSVAYRIDKQLNNTSTEANVVFRPVFHRLELGVGVRLCKFK